MAQPERKPPAVLNQPQAIMLDRERHMQLDFQALAMIEEETGLDLLNNSDALNGMKLTGLAVVIWALLTHEDPELDVDEPDARKAAIRRVRRMIRPDNVDEVMTVLAATMNIALPEVKDADPLAGASA